MLKTLHQIIISAPNALRHLIRASSQKSNQIKGIYLCRH